MLSDGEIKEFLDEQVDKYNRTEFIDNDPVQIPHMFSLPEDIEIAGFLTACLTWGQRKTIINKSRELMRIMNHQPHAFVMNADHNDLEEIGNFCHRTFNGIDAVFFVQSLRHIFEYHGGIRKIFSDGFIQFDHIVDVLHRFRNVFFEIRHPERTRKHIPDVAKKASAKRLNLFLRWMVRRDDRGVDLGIWNDIDTAKLHIPLDIHSSNVSRKLGLLKRKQNDWQAVCELTEKLREFDPGDPVKYDYALFGLGAFEGF